MSENVGVTEFGLAPIKITFSQQIRRLREKAIRAIGEWANNNRPGNYLVRRDNYARTPAPQELMDLADKAIDIYAKERADDLHNEVNYYDARKDTPRIEVINSAINHGAFTKGQLKKLQDKLDAHEEWAQKELARARLTIIVATGTTKRTQEDMEDGRVFP